MINYKLKIETQSEKVLSSDISFVSGDVRAYKFTFDFFDGGVPLDVENCLMVVRARRADGKCIEDAGEIIEGKGVYVPRNSVFAIPGEVRLEIALCDSSKSYITTKIIIAEVIEGIGNECQPGSEEISVFVTLMNQLQSKIEVTNAFIEECAPQKGIDYWTEEDKAEIGAYIDEKTKPFIIDFGLENRITGDKSYAEIVDAIQQGRRIVGKFISNYFVFTNITESIDYVSLSCGGERWHCWEDASMLPDTNGWEYSAINQTDRLGDIEAALDAIIEIQNALIGGEEI